MKYLKTYEQKINNIATKELVDMLEPDLKLEFNKNYKKHNWNFSQSKFKKISIQKVQELIDKGANVNAHDETNNYGSILDMAAYMQDLDLIVCLIENGANINNYNSCKATPLYIVSNIGNIEIVKYLIQKGANVNIPNDSNVLPIHSALWNKNYNIAKLLLKSGSILSTPGNDLSRWISKNYSFQKLLAELHPEELVKVDEDKINKKY